ncbi:MAG TPA: methyltransferase domain-containing protein [Actinomycetota bacterium]|nr:methyltransferase domain-containing protein [Actinomycetota bacterium]
MIAVTRFHAAAEAMAAIGARAAVDPAAMPDRVTDAVDDVLAAAGVPDLGLLEAPQRAMVAAYVRSAFGQTAHLLADPTRAEGWSYTDVAVLEGQGRASMGVPPMIAAAAQITEVGTLLDVGTGVGWLAVAATRVWPGCRVVGIDLWEASVERARANVAESGLADIIEIRLQSVADLPDRDRFDLTWLPSFYLLPSVLPAACKRILAATQPGGQIVVGRYDAPPDPLAAATLRLRLIRDGGTWLEPGELTDLLASSGWSDVRVLPKAGPPGMTLVAGRKD